MPLVSLWTSAILVSKACIYIFFKDTCSQNNTVGLNWLNLFDCVYLNQNYYFSCIARWLDVKFHL